MHSVYVLCYLLEIRIYLHVVRAIHSLLYNVHSLSESQKPHQRVSNADWKVFANPESLSKSGKIMLADLLGVQNV